MRLLPLSWARGLGGRLGAFFYACVPYERRKTLATLERAFPGSDPKWRHATARGVFRNLGRGGAEFLRLGASRPPEDWTAWIRDVEGFGYVRDAVDSGRGTVIVTAHFGNWEMLAAWTARQAPTAVVARQVYDPRVDRALNLRRERNGITVFGRNTPVRPILRWLKEGKILGALADQDTSVDSLYVDFFGSPAKTPSGPAFLARATGADLLTSFCHPLEGGGYRLVFGPPIPLPPRGKDAMDLWPAVQEYTRRTEQAVRPQPEAWAWNHARWRSPIRSASPGWDPRLADACLERIAARGAAAVPGAPA